MPAKNCVNPYITNIKDDEAAELKRSLLDVVGIYYRSLNWALSWVRQVRADVPREEIDGFFLNYREMELLRLDLKDILLRIAERAFNTAMSMPPPLDYWSGAIRRYAFRINADELEWSVPGFDVPDIWRVERLQFMPDPRHLPMSNILEAFRGYSLPLGLEPEALTFVHDGLRIEEGTTLVNNVMAAGTETVMVMIELRNWRERVFEIIGSIGKDKDGIAPASTAPHASDNTDESERESGNAEDGIRVDPQLVGCMVSRAEIARALDRTPRTIKNWDAKGEAPGGLPWRPADETSSNGAQYDISKNWETMLALTARTRDLDRDRQLAEELLNMNKADDSGSNG